MNEFDLIEKYFNWKNLNSNDLGIGDDCALVSIDAHQQIATSVDTLIEGVHFPKGTSASDIAHKALAVNLSDLAAMGATPKYFTLALTLPEFDESWLLDFSSTLRVLANQYQITLVGGDTTKGALSITLNVTGTISQGRALLRSAAQAGDHIFVSNSIGDAALAWRQIQQKLTPSDQLLQHFNTPNPQVELGCALVGVANACIDISDGLEQDLGHILKRSNVGARIDLSQIPLNKEVQSYIQKTQDWCVALAGGDDYELCFSVAPENLEKLKAIEKNLKIKLSEIGVITQNKGIERVGDFDKKCQSYQHF
ncbi:thiamine-monophosphate kinase [Candidatus Thioglobus autotrophicus]|jgi:thiamine-monophosphate kinase|uniref:Thiamine-monophosphate kinase n=1 Tax=Candidatus Thioglobus autotrophicus TaxID=1705394 RepID=A0A0M5LE91_9GAMM|nr:thiamine-phosphate kinase [Candidatus Thioglobus autotrophicus]ALE51910.1 thiamine-monophosphate kinase [Candidatus Thioglobus autotrophicus]WPE15985.1 thiamine-phosphate kinase [Candidatus Thioglobus autotrophicus]